MLKLFLWLRYLRKKKIVFLSITAVALSVGLLIVVGSLFSGFISAFEQAAVEAIGDVVLGPPIKISRYQKLIESLEELAEVDAAAPTLSAQGLLHLGRGDVRAVSMWGVEPGRMAKVTGLKQFLIRQKDLSSGPSFETAPRYPGGIGGYVGIGVVAKPDEETDEYDFGAIEKMLGQEIVLTSGAVVEQRPAEDDRQVQSSSRGSDITRRFRRKVIKFTIVDIVFTGVYYLDNQFVYLPIEELQRTLYPGEDGGVADQIQIKLARGVSSEAALVQIKKVWEGFASEQLGWRPSLVKQTAIATAKQMQSRYVAEFRKQMGVLLLIFGVVSLTVVLLVLCILYMIVIARCKDIAIIKSCGAADSSVASIFIGFGACVGLIGSVVGAVLGYIVTKNINTIEEWIRIMFGLKLWKSSVYMFSKIPNEINLKLAFAIIFFAVVAAIIGALIPAIVAVRTRPVDILRYE
ncbi:MAG: FtsX-like permease family protein [Planctomycetota bacterium]|jgi:lipoprotein-releasing system permease protein